MNVRILLLAVLMLCSSVGNSTTLREVVEVLLASAGAPPPLSLEVSERQVRGIPEVVLFHVSISRDSLLLSLRCRRRIQCGEIVALARYGSAEDLDSIRAHLATALPNPATRSAPVVRAGAQVTLTIQTKALLMYLPVKALGSGGLSDRIRVRDPGTQRIYQAIVVAPKQVRIVP